MPIGQFNPKRLAIFGTATVLLIIVGSVVWSTGVRRSHPVEQTMETTKSQTANAKTYMRLSELASTSSTKAQIANVLENAFSDHKLFEAADWPIPKREGYRLVLATPTVTGVAEQFICGGFFGYPGCGLYLTTATSSRLIAWGESLTGFHDVEDFPDADHVQIGFTWSFLNYSSIAHQLLNLRTGAMVPLMNVEVDLTDTSANMLVTGHGNILMLFVSGQRVNGGISPQEVTLKDADDRVIYQMPKAEVEKLVSIAQKSVDHAPPLVLSPGKDDVSSEVLHVQLFGVAYQLDLKAKSLKPLVSYE